MQRKEKKNTTVTVITLKSVIVSLMSR